MPVVTLAPTSMPRGASTASAAAVVAALQEQRAKAGPKKRTAALNAMAARIRAATPQILAANALDMDAGRAKGLTGAMLDRLELTPARIEAMAQGVADVAKHDGEEEGEGDDGEEGRVGLSVAGDAVGVDDRLVVGN